MPALLGVPGAIARVRRGDSVGAYFLLAWVGYVIATAIMIGLLQGYLWVNFWTMHSFQIGNAFDMLIFMRIAMLQTKTLHVAALNATRERDKLILLAHTDPLTGLVNRRGLNSALNAALPQASAENLLVVYVLDLDGFKSVNDRYGHDAGDNMLVSVAKQLRNSVRSADVVARLGGDEFVVIALGLHSDSEAQELGDKLLANLRAPLDLPQDGISVRATIGYALAPLDGITAASLLKQADAAMYMGKRDGKDVLRRRQAAVSN